MPQDFPAFEGLTKQVMEVFSTPSIADLLPIAETLAPASVAAPYVQLDAAKDKVLAPVIAEAKRRYKEDPEVSEQSTIFQHLLHLQEIHDKTALPGDDFLKENLFIMLVAGSDTVVTVLTWLAAMLANHPAVQRKAQAEIEEVVGDSRLVFPEDLDNLPYVQAIVKETMRLYPPAPIGPMRDAGSEDLVLGDHGPFRRLPAHWGRHA